MANQSLVRLVNERRILTLLRVEGPSTRADIARRLSLTRSTITNVVDDLRARKLVREITTSVPREARELGRPGIGVSLNPDGAYFLGIEIDSGILRFAILNLAGGIVQTQVMEASTDRPQDFVDRINRFLRTGKLKKRSLTDLIQAIGITVPGLVRSDGFVVHLPALGWKNINLLKLAAQKLNLPVFVENNTNAAAFGEVYTVSKSKRDMIIYLKVGIGCGGAAIINGRLVRGATGTAAEFGHMRVVEGGPVCSCGRRGCLEPQVNLKALAEAVAPGRSMTLSEMTALPARTVKAAADGDPRAREAIHSITTHLITGLVSLTNVFNPREIVLGGLMRPIMEKETEELRRGLKAGIVPGMAMPRLSLSLTGEFECAVGAAAIAHHKSFDIYNVGFEGIDPHEPSNLQIG